MGGGAAAISASGGAAEATLEGEGFKLSTLPPVPPAEVKRQCNCKNSRCLKLYCECFASGIYCDPSTCNCSACCNCKVRESFVLQRFFWFGASVARGWTARESESTPTAI